MVIWDKLLQTMKRILHAHIQARTEPDFHILFDEVRDAILFIRFSDGRILGANRAAERLYGYSQEELLAKNIRDIRAELMHGSLQADMQRANETGVLFETLHRRKDGSTFPVEVSAKGSNFAGERVNLSIIRDISDRFLAEQALRDSEETFRAFIEKNTEGIILYDAQGRAIEWNAAQEQITGISRADALGRPAWDLLFQFIPPEEKSPARYEAMKVRGMELLRNQQSPIFYHPIDVTIYRPDGKQVSIQQATFPIQTNAGLRIGSIMRDVTGQKQVEATLRSNAIALKTSEARFRAIFESAAVGIALVNVQTGRPVQANARLQAMLGYSQAELEQMHFGEFTHPGDLTEEYPLYQELADKKLDSYQIEKRYIARDGHLTWARLNVSLIETENNQQLALGIVEDINDRKQAEQKIRTQLERLSALRAIDSAITRKLPLDEVMEAILEQAIKHLEVSAAEILLLNREKNLLEFCWGKGFQTALNQTTNMRVGEWIAGTVASLSNPLKPANLFRDPHFSRGFLLEAENFTGYHGAPLLANGEILGVLEVFHRAQPADEQEWMNYFYTLAGQAAIAIENARMFQDLHNSNSLLGQAYDETIEGLSRAMDLRDHETEGHSRRVTEMSLWLAKEMGLTQEQMVDIRRGALLHDIGKVGVPDAILLKPGALTEEE